jgi:hypothetical protein
MARMHGASSTGLDADFEDDGPAVSVGKRPDEDFLPGAKNATGEDTVAALLSVGRRIALSRGAVRRTGSHFGG